MGGIQTGILRSRKRGESWGEMSYANWEFPSVLGRGDTKGKTLAEDLRERGGGGERLRCP